MNPTNDERALANYRLQQAEEALKESQVLMTSQLWRGVINRAYYAMFYAVLALSTIQGQVISKHSGAIAFFDREYIKTGIFQRSLSRDLHLAFDSRQSHDYGEMFAADEAEASSKLAAAKNFVEVVKTYIDSL